MWDIHSEILVTPLQLSQNVLRQFQVHSETLVKPLQLSQNVLRQFQVTRCAVLALSRIELLRQRQKTKISKLIPLSRILVTNWPSNKSSFYKANYLPIHFTAATKSIWTERGRFVLVLVRFFSWQVETGSGIGTKRQEGITWTYPQGCHAVYIGYDELIDPSHKSQNASDKYPTMHHFVIEICTHVHISVTKWGIVGQGLVHCGIWGIGSIKFITYTEG